MNEYALSVKKMDDGEKIIFSGVLRIDKDVYPTKGKLAKQNIVQKSIRGNDTSGCHGRNRRKWSRCWRGDIRREGMGRSSLGVNDGTGEGREWGKSFWVLKMRQEKGRRGSDPFWVSRTGQEKGRRGSDPSGC